MRAASSIDLTLAIEQNYQKCWANFGLYGGQICSTPGITRIRSAIPHIPYNGIIRTHLAANEIEPAISAQLAWFRRRQLPMFWSVLPSTEPCDLRARLHARGFQLEQELVGMAIELDTLPAADVPSDVELREVDDAQALTHYVELTRIKWSLPQSASQTLHRFNRLYGWGAQRAGRRWIALRDNRPVGKAFLYLAAGVAGVYGVSSLPEMRRQGLGTALTVHALSTARALGYRTGILHSTEMGLGLYTRLGFRERCRLQMLSRA